MFSKVPINVGSISKEDTDKEILRAAIMAELDAINVYEQMANMTSNDEVRNVLLDVAREEKTHIGEFQTLLLKYDAQQVEEMQAGKKQVDEDILKK